MAKKKKTRDLRDVRAWDRYYRSDERNEAVRMLSRDSMEVIGFVAGFRAGLRAGKRETKGTR